MDTNKKTQRQTFKNFPSFEFVQIEKILRIDLIWFIFMTSWGECLSRSLKMDEMARFKILNIKLNSSMDRDSSADSIKQAQSLHILLRFASAALTEAI